jgi:hypothetical protein
MHGTSATRSPDWRTRPLVVCLARHESRAPRTGRATREAWPPGGPETAVRLFFCQCSLDYGSFAWSLGRWRTRMAESNFLVCSYSEDSHRHAILADDGRTGILYLHAPSDDPEHTGRVEASCFAFNRVDPIEPSDVTRYRPEPPPIAQGYASNVAVCRWLMRGKWSGHRTARRSFSCGTASHGPLCHSRSRRGSAGRSKRRVPGDTPGRTRHTTRSPWADEPGGVPDPTQTVDFRWFPVPASGGWRQTWGFAVSDTWFLVFRLTVHFRSMGPRQATMTSDQIRGRHFSGEFLPGFMVPAGDGRIGDVGILEFQGHHSDY